jgi:hypothetical protein
LKECGMDTLPKKRGRPKTARTLISAATNYQALAWEAKLLINEAQAKGKKLMLSTAVRKVMHASVRRRNDKGIPTTNLRVEVKYPTAYTEVRKILREWKRKSINQ